MSGEAQQNQARMKAERWRVFCAVELPPEVRARAAEHIAHLRKAMPDVRAGWEREEKLHVTLKFLGEIEAQRVAALSNATARATQSAQPFTLALENAGAFPTHGVPRVLWLGIKDASGGLALLQQSLEDECASESFQREERAFHPHLTIARVRAPQGARRLAALHHEMGFPSLEFPVTELVVIRSEMGQGGSRYTAISRHQL
jgi:2'-5' RNA ligase